MMPKGSLAAAIDITSVDGSMVVKNCFFQNAAWRAFKLPLNEPGRTKQGLVHDLGQPPVTGVAQMDSINRERAGWLLS